jgi:hypothetical protein
MEDPAPTKGTATADGSNRTTDRPLADWQFICAANWTTPYVDNRGRSWKFCTHCRCRATQRMGMYQLTHFDSEHCSPDSGPPAPTAALPADSISPLPTAPSENHTQVINPSFIFPGPPKKTFLHFHLLSLPTMILMPLNFKACGVFQLLGMTISMFLLLLFHMRGSSLSIFFRLQLKQVTQSLRFGLIVKSSQSPTRFSSTPSIPLTFGMP